MGSAVRERMKAHGQAVAHERMHQAAAIVEDCAMILSGNMTDWKERPNVIGMRLETDIRVARQVIPVSVSGGGVIQINRNHIHPETRETITNTYQAMTALMYHLRATRGMRA